MSFDTLTSKIVSLNKCKNNYAEKKIKGEVKEEDEKDMISTLIYVIAELRKIATDIGISDEGKINNQHSEVETFIALNDNIKNLKSQILFLINSSPHQLKEEIMKQSDHYQSHKTEELRKNAKPNTELSRRQDIIERLRSKLTIEDEDEKKI